MPMKQLEQSSSRAIRTRDGRVFDEYTKEELYG